MPCWISFDEDTASALRSREIEPNAATRGTSFLEQALSADSAVMVMGTESRDVLVARIRRAARASQHAGFEVARWTDENAIGYAAGGMLGLLDEPVYEEEQPAKKQWWRRILE
jgi:hypothetical protein